jgi:anaerobic selenocysteine-containing dehydrogenase
VQGQRTVGITENPELAPLDKLAEQFHFEPPRNEGMATVDACRGVIEGKVRAVLQLGGNLVRSVPDRDAIEPAWRKLRLTVGIATKLNRSHLVHGGVSYILPCLSRIEIDEREGVPQAVSMEDSTGCMHDSRGVARPAGDRLLAEPAIVAGIAEATLGAHTAVTWQAWSNDYALVRDAIAQTPARGADDLRLFTLRSDSQFNTTIYSHDDRFRGIRGSRMVLLMNERDICRCRIMRSRARCRR